MYNSFTCDCGHIRKSHTLDIQSALFCFDCYVVQDKPEGCCYYPWHVFKPNNLKHLERLSDGF